MGLENLSTPNELGPDLFKEAFETERIFCVNAPKISEILNDDVDRQNNIVTKEGHSMVLGGMQKSETFTEREGLLALDNFLARVIACAIEKKDMATLEKATLFRDNLTYIGKHELAVGTKAISRHILELVQNNKEVYISLRGQRSQKYITMLVLEELNKFMERDPALQGHVHFSNNIGGAMTRELLAEKDVVIVTVDDFVLSGSRIEGFAEAAIEALMKCGLSQEDANKKVEALTIMVPIRPDKKVNQLTHTIIDDRGHPISEIPLNVKGYFGAKEIRDSKDAWIAHPGVSATGSHSSTDYGFENEVEDFAKFLIENGQSVDTNKLPIHLERPYKEARESSRKYEDVDLQKRWENVIKNYP